MRRKLEMSENLNKPNASTVQARKTRQAAIHKLGGSCRRCGFNDLRALQIDHVHGGGTRETKAKGAGSRLYYRVLRDTVGKYQLLCANCNWIKRAENNEAQGPRRLLSAKARLRRSMRWIRARKARRMNAIPVSGDLF